MMKNCRFFIAVACVFAAVFSACAATNSSQNAESYVVAFDVRFVYAGYDALVSAGYFGANKVDAALLEKRLIERKDVEVQTQRAFLARLGEKSSMKCVTEYKYPTEYSIKMHPTAKIEFNKYEMREIGYLATAQASLVDAEGSVLLKFDAEIVDEPSWKNYGSVKVDGETSATKQDIPFEQPFFTAVRFGAESIVRLGEVNVFGGVPAVCKARKGKFVLAFVKVSEIPSKK